MPDPATLHFVVCPPLGLDDPPPPPLPPRLSPPTLKVYKAGYGPKGGTCKACPRGTYSTGGNATNLMPACLVRDEPAARAAWVRSRARPACKAVACMRAFSRCSARDRRSGRAGTLARFPGRVPAVAANGMLSNALRTLMGP